MTSMKPTIEMLSRSFDFAKEKTGLQVGERRLQESPLPEKVSFTSLWGIQLLACRSSQFPVGKMTKRWLRRYQHGKAVPPTHLPLKQLGTKEIFLSLPGLALNTYDLVANRRCKNPPRSQSAHLSSHETDTSATGLWE